MPSSIRYSAKRREMKKPLFTAFLIFLLVCSLICGQEKPDKFNIEFFAGFSIIDPSDLNLRPRADEAIQNFYFDDYYDYLSRQGTQFTYSKLRSDTYPRIRNAFSLGFRISYFFKKNFGISFGLRHLGKKTDKEVISRFSFPYNYEELQFSLINSPYRLQADGYVPFVGVHATLPLSKTVTIGAYLEGGPIFARCAYLFEYFEEWRSAEGELIDRSSVKYLEETGRGSGFSMESGFRIIFRSGKLSPFLEGGYSLQKIRTLTGPGAEITGGLIEENWEGAWAVKGGTYEEQWGNLTYEFPSNKWEGFQIPLRDLSLDLSGFQFRTGISYRF